MLIPDYDDSSFAPRSSGATLVDAAQRKLPLRETSLHAEAAGGMARSVLRQTFLNPFNETLNVEYKLPLPADGAVAGFCFEIVNRRVEGVVKGRKAAREVYTDALMEGRTAALLEQDRSSVFHQEVGNIPPLASVIVEVRVDHPLRFHLGQWQYRFPTVMGPRYTGDPTSVPDAARMEVSVADRPLPAEAQLELSIADAAAKPTSPSHPIVADHGKVRLRGPAQLDRDIVIEWLAALHEPGVSLVVGRPELSHPASHHQFGLLSVVPPAAPMGAKVRDFIVLIDVSASMSEGPLRAATSVLKALVRTLKPRDSLHMIKFAVRPESWKPTAVPMTEDNQEAALAWLDGLRASGATEMRDGIRSALNAAPQGHLSQVLVVTDGFINYESQIIEMIQNKPASCTVHAVGVGSAPNRSLLMPMARFGGGREVVVDLDRDVDSAIASLREVTEQPQLTELELSGSALVSTAAHRVRDIYPAVPSIIPVKLDARGGALLLRGQTAEGPYEHTIQVPRTASGAGHSFAAAIWARERAEDLEAGLFGHEGDPDYQLEQLGLDFQIATRLTSWVAVDIRPGVDPSKPVRREMMPHQLPHGVSAEGVGLSKAANVAASAPPPAMMAPRSMVDFGDDDDRLELCIPDEQPESWGYIRAQPEEVMPTPKRGFFRKLLGGNSGQKRAKTMASSSPQPSAENIRRLIEARTPTPKPTVTLQAELIHVRGDRVVLEVYSNETFEWAAGRVEDGEGGGALEVLEGTTQPGVIHPGQRARLVLFAPTRLHRLRLVGGTVLIIEDPRGLWR